MVDESRVIVLDPNRLRVFETGARLFAILAFPNLQEKKQYEAAAEALCSEALSATIAEDPTNADFWRDEYPQYVAINGHERARRLRTFHRPLRDRMLASRMALGFFQEGHSGQPAKLPTSMKRHSLNELAKLVQEQSMESDPENLEKRTWRQSLPVIHLAAAIQVAAHAMASDEVGLFYDINNDALHSEVISLAQVHEKIVLSDPRFGRNRANIIRIRRPSAPPI
jgi:hypothetical protein